MLMSCSTNAHRRLRYKYAMCRRAQRRIHADRAANRCRRARHLQHRVGLSCALLDRREARSIALTFSTFSDVSAFDAPGYPAASCQAQSGWRSRTFRQLGCADHAHTPSVRHVCPSTARYSAYQPVIELKNVVFTGTVRFDNTAMRGVDKWPHRRSCEFADALIGDQNGSGFDLGP